MDYQNFMSNVFKSLEGFPFSVYNEKKVQEEMASCFDKAGISYFREVKLHEGSVIDFVLPHGDLKVGIEVKVKGGVEAIYRQCKRYCEIENAIDCFALVTARSMGFPQDINGKPCYYFSLSRNLL